VRLTRRQLEMLELAAHGLRYKQIATYLGLSVRTVQGYFCGIRERTGTKTRGELLVCAAKAGLVHSEPDVLPGRRGAELGRPRRLAQRHAGAQQIHPQPHIDNDALRAADPGMPSPSADHAKRHTLLQDAKRGAASGCLTAHSQLLGKDAETTQKLHVPAAIDQAGPASARDVLGALCQVTKERARLDRAERALIDTARHHGVTWAKIGRALGMRSAQAAQQRRKRLE